MTKPTTKQQPTRNDLGTKERRKHDFVLISGVSKSERKAKVISPLQRMRDKGQICAGMHEAGKRYAQHKYQAGLSGHAKTVDFNATGGGGNGMHESEAAAYHWAEYGKASRLVGKWYGAVFEAVVCDDQTLEDAGRLMGETNKAQAVAVARFMVRQKLTELCDAWGIYCETA
jgi:hypothetical protein